MKLSTLDPYIDSLSIFLAILFVQGIFFRKLRDVRPQWFTFNKRHTMLSIALGVYYGLAGVYFMFRGSLNDEAVVYTNLRINILLVTTIFGGRFTATIAFLTMVIGRTLLGVFGGYPATIHYLILLTAFYLLCMLIGSLKMSQLKKYILAFLCSIPVLYFYYFTNFDLDRILNWQEAALFYLIFIITSVLVYAAANYIDRGNKMMYQLKSSAMTDMLTSLPNIRYFMTVFEKQFHRSTKRKKPLSLLVIDIDHFKEINDDYGHQAGNTVLSQFSVILKNRLFPKNTLVARIGGEEFAVLMPDVNLKNAALIAETVRSEIHHAHFPFNPKSGNVTISIGVACQYDTPNAAYPQQEALFEAADQALYQAKQNGRDQVRTSKGEPA
ncbi:GGDEF domain-containing protein [Listeria costaricensis]|uniref:GGDEF domain-containing protein n=1 Tax=Listeria costaricensis TaxID=2026604 RepID=UPI000C08D318|nr:GGDEF domain-containing protein [Listeria costaricensis]